MDTPQFITTPEGEEVVVLSRSDYDELVRIAEAVEDAADVAIYDARKADPIGSEPLPADLSQLILQRNGLLRSIRLWRKLEVTEIAGAIGMTPEFVAELEANRTKLTPELMQKLAEALDVPQHWLP